MDKQLDHSTRRRQQKPSISDGAGASTPPSPATRYVMCPDLIIESESDSHVTLCNRETAGRFRISQAAFQMLKRFHTPCDINENTVTVDLPGHSPQSLLPFIKKGLLVDASAPPPQPAPKKRRPVPIKFCNTPALHKSLLPADFVILGIPYDCGGTLECRTAPARIREKSLDYEYGADIENGRPCGWMDVNAGHRILEGARIHDAGDMNINFGESAKNFSARCSAVLKDIIHDSSCPVILGGDRSISYPVVAHLQQDMPLTVLHIAPEPDLQNGHNGTLSTLDNEYSRIKALKRVDDIVSFTGKSFLHPLSAQQEKTRIKARRTKSAPRIPDSLSAGLTQKCALYISIDMALFTSRQVATGDNRAVPGLSQLRSVQQMLTTIGPGTRIVGIDLVGLDSDLAAHPLFPTVACHLLLHVMAIAHRQKETGHA